VKPASLLKFTIPISLLCSLTLKMDAADEINQEINIDAETFENLGVAGVGPNAIITINNNTYNNYISQDAGASSSVSSPKPVDLNFINEDLKLDERAKETIANLDSPIYIVGCRGPTRGGKSFICSRLAQRFGVQYNPFTSDDSQDSVTKGINYVAFPHPAGGTILILDAEGDYSISKPCDPRLGLALTLCVQQLITLDNGNAITTQLTDSISKMLFQVRKIHNGALDLDTLYVVLNRYDARENFDWLEDKFQQNPQFLKDTRTELFSTFKDKEHRQIHFLPHARYEAEKFEIAIHKLAEAIMKNMKSFGGGFSPDMFLKYVESSLKQIRDEVEVIDKGQILYSVYETYARSKMKEVKESIDGSLPHFLNNNQFETRKHSILGEYDSFLQSIDPQYRDHEAVLSVGQELKDYLRNEIARLQSSNDAHMANEISNLSQLVLEITNEYNASMQYSGYQSNIPDNRSRYKTKFDTRASRFHIDISDFKNQLYAAIDRKYTSVTSNNVTLGNAVVKSDAERKTEHVRTWKTRREGKRKIGGFAGRRKKYETTHHLYHIFSRVKSTKANGQVTYSEWKKVDERHTSSESGDITGNKIF